MRDVVFTIKGIDYQIKKESLTFIGPYIDVTYSIECETPESIYLLAFSSSFYERSANDSILLNSDLFFDPSKHLVNVKASVSTEDLLKLIIERLEKYRNKRNNGLYISVAHNCVEALLIDGLSKVDQQTYTQNDHQKFNYLDVVNRFRVMLQKYFMQEKHVSFYAHELHVSPRRLTDMTESVLGKTAKQLITEKILSEALRMLKYTTQTVYETAYELGFTDEANFSTFIKKHTGKTPKMIKEELPNYLEN